MLASIGEDQQQQRAWQQTVSLLIAHKAAYGGAHLEDEAVRDASTAIFSTLMKVFVEARTPGQTTGRSGSILFCGQLLSLGFEILQLGHHLGRQ